MRDRRDSLIRNTFWLAAEKVLFGAGQGHKFCLLAPDEDIVVQKTKGITDKARPETALPVNGVGHQKKPHYKKLDAEQEEMT